MYHIEFTEHFDKAFSKLDFYTQKMIMHWIDKHLSNSQNPKAYGKALSYEYKGLWRYRIGDYRLICHIQDNQLLILAIDIGHRKDIYNK